MSAGGSRMEPPVTTATRVAATNATHRRVIHSRARRPVMARKMEHRVSGSMPVRRRGARITPAYRNATAVGRRCKSLVEFANPVTRHMDVSRFPPVASADQARGLACSMLYATVSKLRALTHHGALTERPVMTMTRERSIQLVWHNVFEAVTKVCMRRVRRAMQPNNRAKL